MFSNIKIRSVTGKNLKNYLQGIARVRLEVFQEFPYLIESNLDREMSYLKKYAQCPESIAVLVFEGSTVVGVSTGIPLSEESAEIHKLFHKQEMDPRRIFYFDESLLLKPYRGRGVGHHFFEKREEHARKLNKFDFLSFNHIVRPENHPQKPSDYLPLEDFWRKRGFVQRRDIAMTKTWKEIGQEKESKKKLAFWLKELN